VYLEKERKQKLFCFIQKRGKKNRKVEYFLCAFRKEIENCEDKKLHISI
jgi:hypothetical protein